MCDLGHAFIYVVRNREFACSALRGKDKMPSNTTMQLANNYSNVVGGWTFAKTNLLSTLRKSELESIP